MVLESGLEEAEPVAGPFGIEVLRRRADLRADFFDYFGESEHHLWFVLPVAEQTPMSIWNRVPLQGLVTAGVPVETAQVLALALWAIPVVITMLVVRNVEVEFALAFALALVLFYWGRPIAWTHPYLELVVASVLWPVVTGWKRYLLLAAVFALMLTHWSALATRLRGDGLHLFTLQSAAIPWETWTVLPVCWMLLMWRATAK